MIHIDRGGNNNDSRYFYDRIIAQGVEFDVIGLSYYPWWHGMTTFLLIVITIVVFVLGVLNLLNHWDEN